MNRTYKVGASLASFKPGDKISDADLPAGVNVQALIAGGFLQVTGADPEPCPACVEQGKARPPKFTSTKELRAHYADKHAGLVPPGEEEE